MNKVWIITLLVMVLLRTGVHGQLVPLDKQMHFAAGLTIGGISATDKSAAHPFWNAVLFSTVCGVGKEFMDIGTGVPEVNDALATALGGVVGGAIVYGVRLKIERIREQKIDRIAKKRKRRKR